MADLITRTELTNALGIAAGDVDSVMAANLDQAIHAASEAVSAYADRGFATTVVTEQRTFEYDGSGFLDVDDCTAVTAVTFSAWGVDTVIGSDYWIAEPYGAPVQTYIVLPTGTGFVSPEMGFTRNLDVLYRERRWLGKTFIKVDATWGWTTVPEAVKRAVIWTAATMAEKPNDMRSESISGYSYTREDTRAGGTTSALPEQAKELLDPYIRVKVG